MNKEEIIKFKEGLDQLNIYLSEHQYLQFRQFFDMLEEKNKVMNLTAITDGVEVVQKHFIDSLTIVKSHDMMEVDSVIDIGTGAGLRYDLDFLIFRLDCGVPLHDPYDTGKSGYYNVRGAFWKQLGLHFAIGYPF